MTLEAYTQRPIIGAGLNNSSVAIKEGGRKLNDQGQQAPQSVPIHYLVVLTELGLVGFLLFVAFFGQIVMIAFRAMRAVEAEMKVLLVGIVGGLASLATQNLADNAFGGHAINAVFWLFAGLIVVIARGVRSERVLSTPVRVAPAFPQLPLAGARAQGHPAGITDIRLLRQTRCCDAQDVNRGMVNARPIRAPPARDSARMWTTLTLR